MGDCDLDLHLASSGSSESSNEVGSHSNSRDLNQLTILYDGRVCCCNVTDIQAKAILSLAAKSQMVEANKTLIPPRIVHGHAISMKRSLQKFLQKRKNRNEASHPYKTRSRINRSHLC